MMKTIIKCSTVAGALTLSSFAMATPRPLPFTYPVETLDKGELELELYGDMTPLTVESSNATGTPAGNVTTTTSHWAPFYLLQNEFEYGLSDRVELGFYQVFEANPQPGPDGPTNTMTFDGFKWEVRTRLAEMGEWPVDVGLYFELETMHDELSFEEKVLLQRRFGQLRLMANLWVEETIFQPLDSSPPRELQFIINPTAGFVYEVAPWFQPGVEYWARGRLDVPGDDPDAVHHFVGPTVHFNWGKLWWTLGGYVDVTDTSRPKPDALYGPLWVRSVLGLTL
jgi:hypothetical protein